MARVMAAAAAAVALAACGGDASAGLRTIEIDVEHSRFSPERILVQAGESVRFVIRNGDPIDHEFILGDDEVQRAHEEGKERHHHGDVPGEVSVPALGTAETMYVFEGPGKLVFACHLPGHYDYGMHGRIEVR